MPLIANVLYIMEFEKEKGHILYGLIDKYYLIFFFIIYVYNYCAIMHEFY